MSKYTESMVQKLTAEAPLNLEKAQSLAKEFRVSYRSVISKAKQLGLAYNAKVPAAARKATGPTKASLLTAIRSECDLVGREGDLTKAELESILAKLVGG